MTRFKPQNIVVDTKGTLGNMPLIVYHTLPIVTEEILE